MDGFQFIIDFLKDNEEKIVSSNFVCLVRDVDSMTRDSEPDEIIIFKDNNEFEDSSILEDLKNLLKIKFKHSDIKIKNCNEYDPNNYATIFNIGELISNEQ